jgi:hypothetical protein
MRSRRIVSWVVAILAGVVAEIGVFTVMPVALHFGPTGPLYAIPPAAFVMTFLAGLFAASVARSRLVAHGAVGGVRRRVDLYCHLRGPTASRGVQAGRTLRELGFRYRATGAAAKSSGGPAALSSPTPRMSRKAKNRPPHQAHPALRVDPRSRQPTAAGDTSLCVGLAGPIVWA